MSTRRESEGPSDAPWPDLGELELDFVQAAADLSQHQAELSELLTPELGLSPYEYWIRARVDGKPPASTLKHEYRSYEQKVRVGDWKAFFHGLECDVENVRDGRFVRIDFGPHTRPLALSGFGVLQYVMCAREPWTPFPALRQWLARTSPPYDCLSGSHPKMVELWGRLAPAKLFEPADPLICSRQAEFEFFDPEMGRTVTREPEEGTGLTASDLILCGRSVLSPRATAILARAGR